MFSSASTTLHYKAKKETSPQSLFINPKSIFKSMKGEESEKSYPGFLRLDSLEGDCHTYSNSMQENLASLTQNMDLKQPPTEAEAKWFNHHSDTNTSSRAALNSFSASYWNPSPGSSTVASSTRNSYARSQHNPYLNLCPGLQMPYNLTKNSFEYFQCVPVHSGHVSGQYFQATPPHTEYTCAYTTPVQLAFGLFDGFKDWFMGTSMESKETKPSFQPSKANLNSPTSNLNPKAKVFTPPLNPNAKEFTPSKHKDSFMSSEPFSCSAYFSYSTPMHQRSENIAAQKSGSFSEMPSDTMQASLKQNNSAKDCGNSSKSATGSDRDSTPMLSTVENIVIKQSNLYGGVAANDTMQVKYEDDNLPTTNGLLNNSALGSDRASTEMGETSKRDVQKSNSFSSLPSESNCAKEKLVNACSIIFAPAYFELESNSVTKLPDSVPADEIVNTAIAEDKASASKNATPSGSKCVTPDPEIPLRPTSERLSTPWVQAQRSKTQDESDDDEFECDDELSDDELSEEDDETEDVVSNRSRKSESSCDDFIDESIPKRQRSWSVGSDESFIEFTASSPSQPPTVNCDTRNPFRVEEHEAADSDDESETSDIESNDDWDEIDRATIIDDDDFNNQFGFSCPLLQAGGALNLVEPCKKPSKRIVIDNVVSSPCCDDVHPMRQSEDEMKQRLKKANRTWQEHYKKVSSCIPPEAMRKTSFAPKEKWVEIYEDPEIADDLRASRTSDMARRRADQERMERLISPVLTPEHRQKMWQTIYGDK